MTARRPLAAAAALLLLSSCAALQAELVARHCQREGAFEGGVNDGLAGRPMDGTGFVSDCEPGERPAFQVAYREGYLAGLGHRPPPPPPPPPEGERPCRDVRGQEAR